MIYCHLDPGLVMMEGLSPYDFKQVHILVEDLSLHRDMLFKTQAQIPVTPQYIQRIYESLNRIPFADLTIAKAIRSLIISVLERSIKPPLAPAETNDIGTDLIVFSYWIPQDVQQMWLDCLAAALFEKTTSSDVELCCATWMRDELPDAIKVCCQSIGEYTNHPTGEWFIPVLASDLDWRALLAVLGGWPKGLSNVLLDHYAVCNRLVEKTRIGRRHQIVIEPSCLHDISVEADRDIRERIVEVITRRAYDCLLPENNDETIKKRSGMRRVSLKKMAPAARLHYHMENNTVTFTMYSIGDHDKGL